MTKNIFHLARLGFVIAIIGEIFDNFVVNHRSIMIILGIIPSYLIFFLLVFYLYSKFKLDKLLFTFSAGLFGLIIIEDLILGHFILAWPIQIFMFCYWFSIVSYALVLKSLASMKLFLLPLIVGIAISLISFAISKNTYLSLAILQMSFWIVSAIRNGFLLNRNAN